jgi:hypothetical protein
MAKLDVASFALSIVPPRHEVLGGAASGCSINSVALFLDSDLGAAVH